MEGFVRQIVGWREYVRGIYWAHMPGYASHNALAQHTSLPRWFWSGDTHMRCLHLAITQSLQTAHAHHIQRLMVIGNFALLAGLEPQALHRWYLGIYIDAFEWVDARRAAGRARTRQDVCTLDGCAEGSAKCGANAPALHARRHGDEQQNDTPDGTMRCTATCSESTAFMGGIPARPDARCQSRRMR